MPDKVYQVAVRYQQPSVGAENVLHARKITAGDPTDAMFLAFANAWKEAIRTSQVNTVTYQDWVATQVLGAGVTYSTITCRQVGGTLQSGLLTGTLTGAVAEDPLPPMATCSLNVHTALRGRSYRTKLSLGGFGEPRQSGGIWSGAFLTNLQAAIDAFRAVYGSGGTDPDLRWCTFSRGIASGCYPDPDQRHHPLVHRQAGDPDASMANITSATVTDSVSTQRTRIV